MVRVGRVLSAVEGAWGRGGGRLIMFIYIADSTLQGLY